MNNNNNKILKVNCQLCDVAINAPGETDYNDWILWKPDVKFRIEM